MIDHPSYKNTGCLEQDINVAVHNSLILDGQEYRLPYSEEAATMLREIAEWESDEYYEYKGTDDSGRRWHISLTAKAG